jgi:hypothetical protein
MRFSFSSVPAAPDADSERGRGLLIVDALSDWLDCRPVSAAHGGGKLVRARCVLPRPLAGSQGKIDQEREYTLLSRDVGYVGGASPAAEI